MYLPHIDVYLCNHCDGVIYVQNMLLKQVITLLSEYTCMISHVQCQGTSIRPSPMPLGQLDPVPGKCR